MPRLRAILSAVLIAVLIAVAATGVASAQTSLLVKDADLGGNITFEFTTPPNSTYLNIVSLTEGPTCFPSPHTVGCLEVGLDLFVLSFQVPGFFGTTDGAGKASVTYSLPADPALQGFVLNSQTVRVDNGKLVEKSDLVRITLSFPDVFSLSLYPLVTDHLASVPVLLDDGRVLIAGGGGASLDQCQRYTPWREDAAAAAPLLQGRSGHTTTLLADGRVLVAGGSDATGTVLASAELYDPVTDTWSATAGGLATARALHSATLLLDGRVLLAGGSASLASETDVLLSAQSSTELFDPSTDTFGAGTALTSPHTLHSAIPLVGGDVLLAGGGSWTRIIVKLPVISDRAQVFSLGSGSWGSEVSLQQERLGYGAARLNDGRVLLAGGLSGSLINPQHLATAEWFDPSSGSFTASTATLSTARSLSAATLLPGGEVLIAGGDNGTFSGSSPLTACDRYDPVLDQFVPAASLSVPRSPCFSLLLPDLSVGVFLGHPTTLEVDLYHD